MPTRKILGGRPPGAGRTDGRDESLPPLRFGDPYPVAVLSSDWHLSDRPPLIRSAEPDWFAAQSRPLSQVRELCHKYDVPLLLAGDLFDKWNPSPALISFAMRELPLRVYAVPGQHDLRHHSLDSLKDTAFGVLMEAGRVNYIEPGMFYLSTSRLGMTLHGFPWGAEITSCPERHPFDQSLHVAVVHKYVWWKDCSHAGADKADRVDRGLLKAAKGYDAVVVGDNHKGFLYQKEGFPPVLNCLLPGNRVQGDILACSRSLYSGKALEIRTSGGLTVRVTGNHPILTPSGFVAANVLKEGQCLLNGERKVDPSTSHDEKNAPSLIEDVFRSISQAGPRVGRFARPRFVEEFHGDAEFIKGDVDIVYPKGILPSDVKSEDFQGIGQSVFHWGGMSTSHESGSSPGHPRLFGILLSPTGLLRRAGLRPSPLVGQCSHLPFGVAGNRFPLFRGQVVGVNSRSLRSGSWFDPCLDENSHEPVRFSVPSLPVACRQSEFLGQLVQAFPGKVSSDQFRTIRNLPLPVSYGNPRFPDDIGDGGPRSSHIRGDAAQGFAGKVTPDQIVSIREFDFHGHVYDLQTGDGFIVANMNPYSIGILISNCGGLMRRKSDEMDYRPSVGLLYSNGGIDRIALDCRLDKTCSGIFSPGAIPMREEELEQLIADLKGASDDPLDFKDALRRALKKLQCPQGVREMVLKSVGE